MKANATTFAIATLAVALMSATITLTGRPAEAESASSTGSTKGVSGMDLGSGRIKAGSSTGTGSTKGGR